MNTLVLTIEKAKKFDQGAAAGSLFDEPDTRVSTRPQTDYASLFDLHFAKLPALASAPVTHAPKPVKAPGVVHVPRVKHFKTKVQVPSLFDDESHPRAEEGQEHYNPETGKTSRGGQFSHNPNKDQENEHEEGAETSTDGQEAKCPNY